MSEYTRLRRILTSVHVHDTVGWNQLYPPNQGQTPAETEQQKLNVEAVWVYIHATASHSTFDHSERPLSVRRLQTRIFAEPNVQTVPRRDTQRPHARSHHTMGMEQTHV